MAQPHKKGFSVGMTDQCVNAGGEGEMGHATKQSHSRSRTASQFL